jgi:hypothetical protein
MQSALVVQPGAGQTAPEVDTQTTLPSVLRVHEQFGVPQTVGVVQIDVEVAGQMLLGKQLAPLDVAWQTWFAAQPMPQVPQLASSVCVSTQCPPQLVKPPVQTQLPP